MRKLTPVLCWFSPPLVAISKYPFEKRSRTGAIIDHH